jgi:hypothetical protein
VESVKLSLRRGVVAVPPHGGVNRSRSHELVRSIVMGKGHKKASTSGSVRRLWFPTMCTQMRTGARVSANAKKRWTL